MLNKLSIPKFVKNEKFLLGVIILAGFILRIYKLGSLEFWTDETFSLHFAHKLHYIYSDKHPCFYYAILKCWIWFFGETEFSARFLSLIFSCGSIYFIFKLGAVLFDKKTGVISAFLLAFSAMHIWYAQETRSYAMVTFFVVTALYILTKIIVEKKDNLWSIFSIFLVLAIITEYIAFLILFSTGIIFLFREYKCFLKKWLLSWLFAGLIFLIWAPVFIIQVLDLFKTGFWIVKPDTTTIINTLSYFNLGYENKFSILFLLIYSYFFVKTSFFLFKGEKWKLAFLISTVFFPIIVIVLISNFKPVYLYRQLLPVSITYYLLISFGIGHIRMGRYLIILISFFILVIFYSVWQYYDIVKYNKKPIMPIVQYITQNYRKDDAVCISTDSAKYTILYYLNKQKNKATINTYLSYPDISTNGLLIEKRSNWKIENSFSARDIKPILPFSGNRLWLVTGSWERDGFLDEDSIYAKRWFDNYTEVLDRYYYKGIYLELRIVL